MHRWNAQQCCPRPVAACSVHHIAYDEHAAKLYGTDLKKGFVLTPQEAAQPLIVHLQTGGR